MYIFLDESGDLGFNFGNSHQSSRFFVITLLIIKDKKCAQLVNKAVYRTLKNKLSSHKSKVGKELKGSKTTLKIKEYFLKHIRNVDGWSLYTIVLDKKLLAQKLKHSIHIDRIYNQMTHQLLERIDFTGLNNVNLIVDRSKNSLGVIEFNDFLYANLSLALSLETKLYITHDKSHNHYGIQAVDMFCYGIARKYERGDEAWYSLFKSWIAEECEF